MPPINDDNDSDPDPDDSAFPALPRPAAPGRVLAPAPRPWTTVAGPRGGPGRGVAAATANAPRVLNRACAVRAATQRQTAATGVDLAWDLELSGMRPLADALPSGRRLSLDVGEEEAAALRERARVRAAARRGGDGGNGDSDDSGGSGGAAGSGAGARSPGTLREMMARAARPRGGDGDGGGREDASAAGPSSSSTTTSAPAFAGFDGEGSAAYGRSWRQLEKTMRERGWRETGATAGGGGGHRKLRRQLPLSGVVQTIVTPSTPGDAIRGVRNVAAQLYKLDREAEDLEKAAAMAAAKGGR
jgi:hypothetical protein